MIKPGVTAAIQRTHETFARLIETTSAADLSGSVACELRRLKILLRADLLNPDVMDRALEVLPQLVAATRQFQMFAQAIGSPTALDVAVASHDAALRAVDALCALVDLVVG